VADQAELAAMAARILRGADFDRDR